MSASNQNKELPMTQFINSIHANDLRWPYSAFWLGLFILSSTMVACTPKPVWKSYQAVSQHSYPGVHWEKADDPEQLGWSSEKLALARRFSEMIGSDAVMIVDNGVVVDAWGDISRNFQCHSMRKSILSALIGIHVEKGNIDLSATIGELGIDDRYPSLSVTEKKATVGDLIKARSGVYHPALGEAASMKGMRPERHSHAPGTFWYYNNWDFNALGTIFEQETGTRIFEEFDRRVAGPLQMEDFDVGNCKYLSWSDYRSAPYSIHDYYLFRMSARDLARFGLLFLRQGRWKSQQIISSEWIRESTANHSEWGQDGGYGYMWWTGIHGGLLPNVSLKAHSYLASGYGGHKLIVFPFRNLVIVHRVNTDSVGRRPMSHQIGRLLWLILSAAGEGDIGPDPSIAAAAGKKLDQADLKRLLGDGSRWMIPNKGIFMGGRHLVISCAPDGTMLFCPSEETEFKGKWWISGDRFYFKILGLRSYFELIRKGSVLTLFDATGTMFGEFEDPSI
jgi:CubicO group peptidase (beta-lactamase class C family)